MRLWFLKIHSTITADISMSTNCQDKNTRHQTYTSSCGIHTSVSTPWERPIKNKPYPYRRNRSNRSPKRRMNSWNSRELNSCSLASNMTDSRTDSRYRWRCPMRDWYRRWSIHSAYIWCLQWRKKDAHPPGLAKFLCPQPGLLLKRRMKSERIV